MARGLIKIFLLCGTVIIICLNIFAGSSIPQLRGFTLSRHEVQDSGPPLYAIADLHGDYTKAIKALQLAGLVSTDGYWAGKQAQLVQLGDLMDRGPHSLDCVNLFRRLKAEARQAGGIVQTLLGNHELMNLDGQYHYVSRQELQRLIKDLEPEALDAKQQMERGLELWKRRLQPDFDIGQTLRGLPVAVLRGEGGCKTLFVHAGLPPGLLTQLELHRTEMASPEELLQDLNDAAKGVLRCAGGLCKPSEQASRQLHDPDGVLWYRGYAEKSERNICSGVAAVLKRLGAAQMVVGHNVVPEGKARRLCKDTLYMMDVGMSVGYMGADAIVWKCHKGHVRILP